MILMTQGRDQIGAEWGRGVSWIFTPFYIVVFISLLLIFHLVQVVAARFGKESQKRALDIMNLCIIWNIRLLAGARFSYLGQPSLPSDRAVIIVSNHQSMYDIPMIMWACRSRQVGFIAKRELGKWIPSISLALRDLGSVLIDRKDARGSIQAIEEFGRRKELARQVAAIFPEGTRARDGAMKNFRPSGLIALLRSMPTALIQPVAIRGNWRILRYNFAPVPFRTTVEVEFLQPIDRHDYEPDQLLSEIEGRIRAAVGDDRG